MHNSQILLLALALLSSAGCSSSKFKGDSAAREQAAGDSQASSGDGDKSSAGAGSGSGSGGVGSGSGSGSGTGTGGADCAPAKLALHGVDHEDDDDDKNASKDTCQEQLKVKKGIEKCLANWGGKAPFTAASPHRSIYASVSVFGYGNAIDDKKTTTEPELVVIYAAVNVLGQPKYRLMNPKGWYCMIADVNVIAKLTIDLQTDAHLADSRVDVNVLGGGDSAGIVAVNVMSDVTVNQVDK